MNLNLINKNPDVWNKSDWQSAYDRYDRTSWGNLTKKEYYDQVMANYNKRIERDKPLDPELATKWSIGRRNAKLWAQTHECGECDMNGRLVSETAPQGQDLSNAMADISFLQKQQNELKIALKIHTEKINRNFPNM